MPDQSVQRLGLTFGLFSVLIGVVDKLFGVGYILRMSDQGLSPTQIAVVISIGSVVLAVVDFPAGNIADIWGRKRAAALGALCVAIGMLIYAIAVGLWGFMLAIGCWAAGMALITGSPSAWLVDRLEDVGAGRERTKILSRSASIALVVGALAALLVASPLLRYGPHVVLLIGAATAVITAVLLFLVGEDNRGAHSTMPKLPGVIWENTRLLARDRFMRLVLLKNALQHIGFTCFLLSYQLFATQQLGLPQSAVGAILAGSILTMALGTWMAAPLAQRWGLGPSTVAGVVGCVAGYATMSLAGSWVTWITGLVLFEVGLGVDMASFRSWLHDFAPSERRASWLSAASSVQTLVGVAGTLAAGTLISIYGFRPVWAAATVVTALTVIPLALLLRQHAVKPKLEQAVP